METSVIQFDLPRNLREILSDGKETPCIFDRILERLESHSNRAASSIYDIKRRDDKKLKGNAWESFCHFYLSTVLGYYRVWLWNDVPVDIRSSLRLLSRVDNGIDIIAQRVQGGHYTAAQCKYRGKITQLVTWTTLSTFVGLCAQTGPWEKHLVMTNCKGVSRKLPKTSKDQTMAYGTFKNLTRHQCLAVDNMGLGSYQKLSTSDVVKTQDELRAARLARFSSPESVSL